MDKRRQELEELKDDIHLALLMDEYADSMGAQVRAEAEKAFDTGEITIPQEVDDASRSILSQTAKVERQKKSTKAVAKYLLVAAATVVLLLGTLTVVQASGINVFGRLSSWTDSVFHLNSEEVLRQPKGEKVHPEIEAALNELDLPVSLAPVWLPDGYTVVEVEKATDSRRKTVGIVAEKDGRMLQIVIGEYKDEQLIDSTVWEKDPGTPQIYTSNNRTFQLFQNNSKWAGVWADKPYMVSLFGFESLEELQKVIASIGEN